MVVEVSAGAICYKKENDEYLFLIIKHKNGLHFSFPKGHLLENEPIKDGAIREVFEETGINIKIVNDNFKVNSYPLSNGNYKEVYYFLAEALNDDIVIQEEEVLEAGFYKREEVLKKLTYNNDKVIFYNMTKSLN